ncbi:hypothetical protein WMY93_017011 [Mugilogobius chulae]|uniref:Uncharacterized protein n=1 Tax=Mugilogobius chulae TaxID=88201 RepID=A0AAW0NTG8_9GOBI
MKLLWTCGLECYTMSLVFIASASPDRFIKHESCWLVWTTTTIFTVKLMGGGHMQMAHITSALKCGDNIKIQSTGTSQDVRSANVRKRLLAAREISEKRPVRLYNLRRLGLLSRVPALTTQELHQKKATTISALILFQVFIYIYTHTHTCN